jgi:uncharacterized protein (TIGR03032 family)
MRKQQHLKFGNPMPADSHTQAAQSFTSVHTSNLPAILNHYGISLAVSTYQAGRLVLVRADGQTLNTHFELLQKPMGITVHQNQLYLGIKNKIIEYRNVPAAGGQLEMPEKFDGCFVPRQQHITGDIDIHEMACDDAGKLWFINTRFSCLCSLQKDYSFVPEWRPSFISAYAPQDRCHLNGLAMRDGKPRYVTALGQGDTAGGWRENKRDGGILLDITDNRIIATGLSMPHSPRWYQDKLWVLESGYGHLSTIDPASGKKTVVAEMPGFTRGITFIDDFAFVGLSQVRESATFNNLPLLERQEERACGVWVINIQTGNTIGFLKFDGIVQEIFAVQVIPNCRYPALLADDNPLVDSTYVLPDKALAELDPEFSK